MWKTILTIYIIAGFIYALYVSSKRPVVWYHFPINVVLGPVTVIYLVILIARGKRIPIGR
jgi:hypothetical protein